MTNEALLNAVVDLYRIARNSTTEYEMPNIKRGRNHSLSSMTEDLLAYFILKRVTLPAIELWVDYPISFRTDLKQMKNGNPCTKTIYPDIAIVSKSNVAEPIITHIVDLKMDLGWKRDLQYYLDATLAVIDELRKVQKVSYKVLDENNRKSKYSNLVNISENLTWHVVIMSDQNIKAQQMDNNEQYVTLDKFKGKLSFYIFSKDVHPNIGTPTINHEPINSFLSYIESSK